MSKIKNYIDALNAVRTLIVTDSVSDNDIEMYANVIYHKIMEHDSPELAASYIVRNLFKEHKAETTRIACNYQVEHSTMMADRYAYLIRCIGQKIEKMTIPIDEDTENYMQSLQPQHEELPEDLNTDEAKGYLQRLVDHKFCDINYHWNKDNKDKQKDLEDSTFNFLRSL